MNAFGFASLIDFICVYLWFETAGREVGFRWGGQR
jgi:hypothetical protein